jgi:hypothetical protein
MPVLLAILAVLLGAGPVLAQATIAQAPTAQERAACQGDARRFCASAVGKPDEMRACLAQNKVSLSSACRAVVESRGG